MSRGFVFSTWNQQTFWRHGGGLPCSRPWLPTRSFYDVWRWCLWPDSNNAPQESIWMGRQTSPQGGTRFRMLRAQFWTLAQSKYFRRDPKVDPLRIESGPSWRACFWSLHFVRCAEALQAAMCAKCQAWSYFNTNSIRGRNLELFEALVANS